VGHQRGCCGARLAAQGKHLVKPRRGTGKGSSVIARGRGRGNIAKRKLQRR